MGEPSGLRRFGALLRTQLLVAAGFYLSAIWGFLWATDYHGDAFAGVAFREYLSTIVLYQLRVVPAYLVVALCATVLAFPLLHRAPALVDVARREGRWRRGRLLVRVGLVDAVLGVLSLGPFYRQNPGLLDGTARKMATVAPDADLYVLYRWHILDAAAIGFALVGAYALWFYGLRWWRSLRSARPLGRMAHAAPVVAVLGAGTWSAVPASPPAAAEQPAPLNILIIAGDSLRADHLGVHGYHRRDISPHIDAFAADAADFTDLHVATASTLESWMTMMTSQFPPDHGVRYMYLRREQAEEASRLPNLLPRVLNGLGYATTVVSNWAGNNFRLVDVGFTHNLASDTQNFESFLMEATIWTHLVFPLYFSNALGEWMLPEATRTTKYLRPSSLNEKMFDQIDAATRQGKPFFGLLFYSTTHLPYTASYPYNVKYVDPAYDGPHRYQIDVRVHDLITTGFDPDLPADTVQHIRNLYDGAVSEFDAYVGRAIADLKHRGLYDRTIIIVTSDHGEDLYDPGSTLGHGTNFFGGDQSTRIPFFIRVPGVTRPGSKITALARNIDIAPTLLSLIGAEVPDTWTGMDLTGLLTGAVADLDLPVFAETCYLFFPKSKAMLELSEVERARVLDSSSASDTLEIDREFNNNMVLRADLHDTVLSTKDRMVRTRRWKLIHIPGKDAPIYRLYDVQADPGQKRDLSGTGLPVMPRLIELLDRYWAGEGARQRWPQAWEDPSFVETLQ